MAYSRMQGRRPMRLSVRHYVEQKNKQAMSVLDEPTANFNHIPEPENDESLRRAHLAEEGPRTIESRLRPNVRDSPQLNPLQCRDPARCHEEHDRHEDSSSEANTHEDSSTDVNRHEDSTTSTKVHKRSFFSALNDRVISDESTPKITNPADLKTPTDFVFETVDDMKISCHRVLLESMCSMFNISSHWSPLTSMELPVEHAIVDRVVNYMYFGYIEIEEAVVESLLKVADFLGFEALSELCVKFIGTSTWQGTLKFVKLHYSYEHVLGFTNEFTRGFSDLPTRVFGYHETDLLKVMSPRQFRTLLDSDSLQVRSEDDAVHLVSTWIRATKPSMRDIALALERIRKPFITRRAADYLIKGFGREHGLPDFRVENTNCTKTSKPRNHYDRHIHILWKANVGNPRGPTALTVTCVTWSADNEYCEESTLFTCREGSADRDDPDTAEYKTTKNSITRVMFNRSRSKLVVSHLNLKQKKYERSHIIGSLQGGPMLGPDYAILKNPEDISVSYYDGRAGKIRIASFDAETHGQVARHNVSLERVPCCPRELQLFDDCAVAITCDRVFVMDAKCENAREIRIPTVHGTLNDFARVGDSLFVLEDFGVPSYGASGVIKRDRLHRIDLKTRKFISFGTLPLVYDEGPRSRRMGDSLQRTKKLLIIESQLHIVVQANIDDETHIFHYDIETRRCVEAATLEYPKPEPNNSDSVHARAFMGTVAFSLFPCSKTQQCDLDGAMTRSKF